ncbi:nucleotide-diphosphate-sugar epimerase [Aliidongia dinghuensis]|uniref:Nucleotide-diphosphate-sugar epimerase n=1 Tax=Aliidongia dinghuensis TaxID=1867774 RepID=A0A8J2YXC8_9PROT|nr:NmrA family NAD(P)-binding protein [Aliidongia dinghuensis]GGF36015.1 nucleotide-diphosphate-sugar epimerase [Aliidongia dinghuensis]
MSAKILVTGPTGKTGKRTVEHLIRSGQEVRVFAHSDNEGSKHLRALGAEVVFGDLLDYPSIRTALQGIGAAYLCYPVRPGLIEATAIFAEAAVDARVGAVVNMSQICARREAKSHAAFNHWVSERVLDRTGIAITHLRPTFFAEWFAMPGLRAAIKEGHVKLPFHDGTHAPIAAEDQARFIAEILQRPMPHAGKTYELCGPQQRPYREWFQELSGILGREIRYDVTTEDETRTLFESWFNGFLAQHILEVSKDYNAGVFAGTDEVIERYTGQKPMTFDTYIRGNLGLYEA